MTDHPNLKILLFIGPAGSGKSTAVHYLAQKGFPKVSVHEADDKISAEKTIDQVQHLADAGQHRIVIDDISSIDEYHVLKHAFPGELTTIAINDPNPIADHLLRNDDSLEDFYQQLDAIAHELGFN